MMRLRGSLATPTPRALGGLRAYFATHTYKGGRAGNVDAVRTRSERPHSCETQEQEDTQITI